MIVSEDNWLAHYGIIRRSGRYPYGSSGNENNSDISINRRFIDEVNAMKRNGISEAEIAKVMGATTTQLRAEISIASNFIRQDNITQAQRLKDKSWSNTAIAERMGVGESTVRGWLAPGAQDKADALQTTANMLRRQVDEKEVIQIGSGVEIGLGISETRLKTAAAVLQEEGYRIHNVQVDQAGTTGKTTVKVLTKEGIEYRDVANDLSRIRSIDEWSDDGGRTMLGIHPPLDIASKRVQVVYGDEGGKDADGVIYVRPGVKDLDMGGARYGQVRISVDGTHYLKGMAIVKDDLPPGVDLQFNTNKTRADAPKKLDAMKKQADDVDNPFGATIRQMIVRGKDGVERNTSAINFVGNQNNPDSGVEGNWDNWSKSLSSQMLSKQSPKLAKEQLGKLYEKHERDFADINALTNPVVKKALLDKLAEQVDSDVVHLKAAPLPGQSTHVILPVKSLKDTEIYAPNYNNGDKVVLIRHPHGGKFEIPELTVNNNHRESKKLLGRARDAVGINSRVASKLSGADFDGDAVIVIPNNNRKVKSQDSLESLKDFDPQRLYKLPPDAPKMPDRVKQIQMGDISNLITDMTIRGANDHEIAAAVRHSMVVIDAAKHHLDYKRSARDNGIPNLKKKYQGRANSGATTIVSRSKKEDKVDARRARRESEGGPIDARGRKQYVRKEGYYNKKGEYVYKQEWAKRILEAEDAHTLSSGMPIEKVYADHANRMKALADKARLTSYNTPPRRMSVPAKKVYEKEVASLDAKYKAAVANRPRERTAQLYADTQARAKKAANPDLTQDQLAKVRGQALVAGRLRVGAKTPKIEITDKEWEAIQAGAISTNRLEGILAKSDIDRVRELATPKARPLMDSGTTARAKALLASGATQAEVAAALGVSLTTLKEGIK